MKKKKIEFFFITPKRKKKGGGVRWEFDLRPPVIEPRSTESEPDVLTTRSMHMELTRDQAQNTCD